MTAPILRFGFLEEEMRRQNITLAELEERSGIPDSTISRIFRGIVSEPGATQIMPIAIALGLDFNTVMRRAGLTIPDPAAPNAETLRQAVALDADPELAGLLRKAEVLTQADRLAVLAYMELLEQQRAARQKARHRRRRNGPQSLEEVE